MDLTLTAEEQAFRDEVRRWLKENHPGPEPEGEQAKFEFRREWPRRDPDRAGDLLRGDGSREGAVAGQRARAGDGRAGRDRAWHRGAEGAPPGADPLCRRDLVPGLL